MNKQIKYCWLFCTVIDNFGDIGVSWRLAQALTKQLNWKVYLWLDDATALHTIIPDSPQHFPSKHQSIALRNWQEGKYADLNNTPMPDIVIETFACTLPNSVHNIIQTHRPLWLNWEYLSAETWATRTHTMQSLQSNGSKKYFWQMGFSENSGGLLREPNYSINQQQFTASKEATLRQNINILPHSHNTTDIFIFGYISPVWANWIHTLNPFQTKLQFWLAGGQVAQSIAHQGILPDNCRIIPFVPQNRFDEILWAADILCIRGEDSFVRAQLSGKPMFWHIYPQQESAHLDKLEAFWQIYYSQAAMPPKLQNAHHTLSEEINGARTLTDNERQQAWQLLLDHLNDWQHAAFRWQQYLMRQSDAVSRLAAWCASMQNT